jgi:hypothetical protein
VTTLAEDAEQPLDAEAFNMACFRLTRALETLGFAIPEASQLARGLLRVVGRVVIDVGVEGADPAVWPNTEEMALQWIDEAIKPLGYEVKPIPGGGRSELPEPSASW